MPRLRTALAAAAALACLGAAAAPAPATGPAPDAVELAGYSLDTLLGMEVTGASRIPQRLGDVVPSVTVLTAADLRVHGWRTLAEALAAVRGVVMADDHSYTLMGVRGFFAPGDYNTRVLLLVDGQRVNDTVYDMAYVGQEFPLDLAQVERVEFVAGPGSAVYGANALFGVVNVITKAPDRAASSATVALGGQRRREAAASLTRTLAGGGFTLAVSGQRTEPGPLVLAPATADAPAVVGSGDRTRRDAASMRLRLGALDAGLLFMDRQAGIPASSTLRIDDPRSYYRDTLTLARAQWSTPVGEATRATLRAFAGRSRFDGRYVVDPAPAPRWGEQGDGQWWGTEAHLVTTRWAGHTLLVGFEAQRASRMDLRSFIEGEAGPAFLDDRHGETRLAAFVEDQVALGETLTAVAGARHERRSGGHHQFSPRLALHWRARPDLALRALHGTAYRPPNVYESRYAEEGASGFRANPSLGKESVSSDELGLDWRWHARGRLGVAAYRNRVDHLIGEHYDPVDDRFDYRNLGALTAQGLELEAEWLWARGGRVRASVDAVRVRERGAIDFARFAPRRSAKLLASWPLARDWTLGVEGQAVARRAAAAGFGLVNVVLSQPVEGAGWHWRVGVHDLFDRRPADPGSGLMVPSIPRHGRSWQLELTAAF
jgi:iron complex outermembrane receptor protein